MAKRRSQIVIPVKDWVDFVLKEEIVVTTRKEMIQLGVERGPRTAAIAGIVSRLLGHAPDDILKPNKSMLHKGASYAVYYEIRTMREQIELETGKTVSVPRYNKQYVSPSTDDETEGKTFESTVDMLEAEDEGYAEVLSKTFYNNAVNYLRTPVLGHIRNRLTEVVACKGLKELRREADRLIDNVNEIVDELNETNNHVDD